MELTTKGTGMDKQDQLEELLVDWEQHRRQGKELTLEEICEATPELIPELSKLIRDFKATDWLEEDDDSDDDFLHLPDFSTVSNRADETRLPKCKLGLDEFYQRLIESGLMDEAQVRGLRDRISANDARSFAHQLVNDKKLTRFQATVLLEGRDIPLVLDRYVLLGEIGKGGMGVVYKALHQQMDRVVALKILPKEAVDSPEKVKRFQREVKAAAKLEHPNIVTAHDATEANGTHFLVMSLVSGRDLSQTVRKQGPVSCAKAVDYITQAAQGLEHAHSMGIIHRDIKPANLLLGKQGKVKILDMGLARIDGGDPEHDKTVSQELTHAGMVMGTIAYLAPEQALDTRTADARSDIYSLGCTLYYLLNGKNLYNEDTMMKTIMAHREGAIPSLCEQRADVPAELDGVFQKMVAKKPEDRFQSMTEVISAFEALDIKDEEGTQPVVAGSQAYHDTATFIDTSRDVIEPVVAGSGKLPKRRWGLIAGGLFGLLLLAGLIIKLQTPAGTVVLEIDQPELIGAVVTVDGEKKITIKTGKGNETIEIRPDGKRHELEIKLAGFKTFAREFTFETGNKQSIKVRLEPLDVVVKTEKPSPLSSDGNWALEFDGKDNYVELPTLALDHSLPITFEAILRPYSNKVQISDEYVDNVSPVFMENTSLGTPNKTAFNLIYDNHSRGYWFACQQPSKAIFVRNKPDTRHIAAVWTGSEMSLFCDGMRLLDGQHDIDVQTSDIQLPASIGRDYYSQKKVARYFYGIIHKVRISQTARYTKDFTADNRFDPDAQTLALYDFDEGTGDVLKDSSGNGHDGKIIGAKWVKVDDELNVIDGSSGVSNEANVSTLR